VPRSLGVVVPLARGSVQSQPIIRSIEKYTIDDHASGQPRGLPLPRVLIPTIPVGAGLAPARGSVQTQPVIRYIENILPTLEFSVL
jgi:hypothetical protein